MNHPSTPEPGRIHELIAKEDAILSRVTDVIRQGESAGRISHQSAEAMIATAQQNRDGAVRLLRELAAWHEPENGGTR